MTGKERDRGICLQTTGRGRSRGQSESGRFRSQGRTGRVEQVPASHGQMSGPPVWQQKAGSESRGSTFLLLSRMTPPWYSKHGHGLKRPLSWRFSLFSLNNHMTFQKILAQPKPLKNWARKTPASITAALLVRKQSWRVISTQHENRRWRVNSGLKRSTTINCKSPFGLATKCHNPEP